MAARRTSFSIGSPGVSVACSACQFPAHRDAANDTDLCPISARRARPPFPIRVFRPFPLPERESQLARESGRPEPGLHLPSRLPSLKPMSPLAADRHTDVAASRLHLRLLQSWLSSTGALDSRKNNYTEREDWYGADLPCLPPAAAFHPFDGHCEDQTNERTNERTSERTDEQTNKRELSRP